MVKKGRGGESVKWPFYHYFLFFTVRTGAAGKDRLHSGIQSQAGCAISLSCSDWIVMAVRSLPAERGHVLQNGERMRKDRQE